MRIKIFQINSEKDTEKKKFQPLSDEKIDSTIYKNVYFGDVNAESLEDIYTHFNGNRPATHQGHSLSVSDVIEVLDGENKVVNGKYFCDRIGFKEVEFDTSKSEEMSGMRVVYVTPNNTPIDIKIKTDIKSLQNAVGGLIEPIYNYDGTIIVGNDEAKLIGMKGNRRLENGSVIAGPFFVCGDGGENFISLTDEQIEKYMNKFAEPEQISNEEVEDDMGFVIYGI